MTVDARIETLHQKHKSLESDIQKESLRPSPNQMRLTEMKRKKLVLKEEILRHTKH